jgi:hypothetical protein
MISFLAASAQTPIPNPITVTTDKSTYSDGETIMISGVVTDQLNIPISIIIKDPGQQIVSISQANPQADKSYSTQMTAGGNLWTTPGQYEIDVTYASKDRSSKTTFEYTGNQAQNSTGGNQTNSSVVIPEFGNLSSLILVLSILVVVIPFTKKISIFRL